MSQAPLVSVVLNTYNRADLLPQSVESVLAQDYPNFELIIVDDCSQDNTPEVVAATVADAGDRVRRVRLPENRGLAAARNVGIRMARGSLVALQDDDDIWLPGKLSTQVDALNRRPECALVYGKAVSGTADGRPTDRVYGGSGRGRTGDNFEVMLRHHPILGPATVVRKSVLEEVGLFDETLRTAEDTDLFLRLTMRHPAAYVDRPVVIVREHEDRKTQGESQSATMSRCCLQAYCRLWNTLPPERQALRGLVAGWLVISELAIVERESQASLGRQGLMDVIEAHPEWFDYSEGLWHVADRLVAKGPSSARDVMWMAAQLRDRASDKRQGRRRAAMFLNAAARRGIRRGMPHQAVVCAARAALLMPRVVFDEILSRAQSRVQS